MKVWTLLIQIVFSSPLFVFDEDLNHQNIFKINPVAKFNVYQGPRTGLKYQITSILFKLESIVGLSKLLSRTEKESII